MQDISKTREEIDAIDTQILALFKERIACAEKVAAYKQEHHLPILDKNRERDLLYRRCQEAGPKLAPYTKSLFELLMEASRNHQRSLINSKDSQARMVQHAVCHPQPFPLLARVACQGTEGSYQSQAVDKLFNVAQLSYFSSFDEVFKAVDTNACDFGVLPIENSTAGSVTEVFDLMMKYNFSIARTCRLKIDHCLLGSTDANLSGLTDIYSHEQALYQCSEFLSKNSHIRVHKVANTAIAARQVAAAANPTQAAIASANCAPMYGLSIICPNIQNSDNNYTRFACISKDVTVFEGAQKTSLMLVVNHEPGALYRVLAKFFDLDINLIKLESRPIPHRDFEFMFYFDIECPVHDPRFEALITSLPEVCESYRYLGSYLEV